MERMIVGIVFLFIGFVIFLIGSMIWLGESRYEAQCLYTDGVVVRYSRRDSHRGVVPIVSFTIDGKEHTAVCRSRRVDESILPIGSKVPISYVQKEFFGKDIFTVRMTAENLRPLSLIIVGKVLAFAGAIFLIFGAGFIIINKCKS